MVIQSNMAPKAIAEVWEETSPIFKKFNIPLTIKTLEAILDSATLSKILIELNSAVGSSTATCIEGG